MADTLWLARHGNREDFVDDTWRDTAERPHDPDLSPDGVEQARHTGRALRGEGIQAVYASPFLRTVHTASLIADEIGAPVHLEWGFAEWMNADWFPGGRPETLTRDALCGRFGCIDTAYASRFELGFPEEKAAACRRAARTVQALAEAAEGTVLFVGHGVCATAAAEQLTGRLGEFGGYPLCGLTRLRRAEGRTWAVDGPAASVAHLPGGAEGGDRLN